MNLTPAESKQQIATLRAELAAQISSIRADQRYSEVGRRAAIASAWRHTAQQAAQLHAEYATTVRAQRADLERKLFGLSGNNDPNTLISWRDAGDRADRITKEDDAAAALNRARNSGDTHLAKAVLQRAFAKGWTSITASAEDVLPGSAERIAALDALPTDRALRVLGAAAFGITRAAITELAGASDEQVAQWAGQDAPPANGAPAFVSM